MGAGNPMRAPALAALLAALAGGACYTSHGPAHAPAYAPDAAADDAELGGACPAVEAAYAAAGERLGCPFRRPLAACPGLGCDELNFAAERAAGRPWRADVGDLERVFAAARSCDELERDVEAVCTP